jgi:hypothetical protein
MKGKRMRTIATITGVLAIVGGLAISAQDKYTVKVPNGLAFSEFRGYEAWQVVSISQNGNLVAKGGDGPYSSMTLHLTGSGPAPWPTSRRRGTTPSAGSRVTRA